MKDYHIYVFTQDGCSPCDVVKTHVSTLTPEEQAEIDFVSYRVDGERTQLAEELGVAVTPTLVVVHEDEDCVFDDAMGYEFCELTESSVERFIGGKAIIQNLNATLDAYTYVHDE